MKKSFIIFSSALLIMACGNSGETKSEKTDSAAGSSTTTTASPDKEKALEMIAASDCHTCHKLNKDDATGGPIGPIYTDVAAKYSPAADTTVDRLIKKIISGGTGVWGALPMTAHPLLKETDVKTMVTYILSLKK